MLNSFKTCLSSLQRRAKTFMRAVDSVSGCKRRKPKSLSSNIDLLTSSFASMGVSNQFKQVFKVIDANGDGKISTFELSEVLLCLGHEKSTAAEEAEGMMKEIDCNGDGHIDLDEFMEAVSFESKVGSGNEEDCLMDAFLIFDADENGLISAKELQRVLISLGCYKCSLRECTRMIKGVDKDGDGFVDFEEFRSMMTRSSS